MRIAKQAFLAVALISEICAVASPTLLTICVHEDGVFAGDLTSSRIGVDVPAPMLSIGDEFGPGR